MFKHSLSLASLRAVVLALQTLPLHPCQPYTRAVIIHSIHSFYREMAIQCFTFQSLPCRISVDLKTLGGIEEIIWSSRGKRWRCILSSGPQTSPGKLFIEWLCFVTITIHQKIALKIKLTGIEASMFYLRIVFLWHEKRLPMTRKNIV